MPRPSRSPSNFTSDRHVFYAGWVIGEMHRSGLPVTPVRDTEGNYTNRVTITATDGGEVTLLIPPPPDDWDLLTSNGATSEP